MANEIATVEDLRLRLNIENEDDEDKTAALEDRLAEAIGLAQRITGRMLELPDVASDPDDEVTGVWPLRRRRYLRIPDARSVSLVLVDGEEVPARTLTEDGYELIGDPTAWTIRLPAAGMQLEITGTFALWPTPKEVKGAILDLAGRQYKSAEGGLGDVVEHGDDGALITYTERLPLSIRQPFELWQVPMHVGSSFSMHRCVPPVPLPPAGWEVTS
jgi:hypothetical protein